MKIGTIARPVVGAMADHKFRDLDPRPVAEVSADGNLVRLDILGTKTEDWFPASNYRFTMWED